MYTKDGYSPFKSHILQTSSGDIYLTPSWRKARFIILDSMKGHTLVAYFVAAFLLFRFDDVAGVARLCRQALGKWCEYDKETQTGRTKLPPVCFFTVVAPY